MPVVARMRFFSARKHLLRKHKQPRKHLSSREIYNKKQEARKSREEQIQSNKDLQEFFSWILRLKLKLRMTNALFASRIGVTDQTVKLWLRKTGHFPSQRSFTALLELEKEANLSITELLIVRIRK